MGARLTSVSFALLVSGCIGGDGWVTIELEGQRIADGIPAWAMADDWEVTFHRFSVALDNIELRNSEGRVVSGATANPEIPLVYDLAQPPAEGRFVILDSVTGSIEVSSASFSTSSGGGLGSSSFIITGTGKHDGVEKVFTWVFGPTTHYSDCLGGTNALLTVDGSGLFRGPGANGGTELAFQAIADADTNDNGQIEPDELRARTLENLQHLEAAAPGAQNLWEVLEYRVARLAGTNHQPCATVDVVP